MRLIFNKAGVLIVLILTTSALGVFAAESIGRVIALEGKAGCLAADGAKRQLLLKSPVYRADTIVTAADARMQIMFLDDTVISLGEKSRFVLDEYVYAGGEGDTKEDRCGISVAKGVLRIITGKITQLNPERFKVRTRMATIGIRGCDVGLRVGTREEQVYVLHLPPGHSVWVEPFAFEAAVPLLDIKNSGMLVHLGAGGLFEERRMEVGDALRLINESTPGAAKGASSSPDAPSGGSPASPAAEPAGDGSSGDIVELTEAEDHQKQADKLLAQAIAKQEEAPEPEPAPSSGPPPPPPPPEPQPESAPYTPPPETPPPVMVGGHPEMDDWEWGLWNDGTVQYKPNSYMGAQFIGVDDFGAIVAGSMLYDLNGFGMAGAVLRDNIDGVTREVQGSCSLQVLVGQGGTPVWGGSFNLSNMDGDALAFAVDRAAAGGGISAEGALYLNALDSYSMTVNSLSFGSGTLTGQSVSGHLVVPGIGSAPISGAAGEFHFQHDASARADGAFGATF